MASGRLAIGALLAATAWAPAALAQETRHVDIDLTASVAHDSNVARSSAQLAALRHITPDDVTYSPALTVDLLLPVGRELVFLNGSTGYEFHDTNKRLDTERVDLTGGVRGHISFCNAELRGAYAIGQSQLSDLVVLTTIKNTLDTETAAVDVNCGRPSGVGVNFSASEIWANNSTVELGTTDHTTTSYSGGLFYGRPALGTVKLFGTYARTEYPNSIAGSLPGLKANNGYEINSGGVTLDRRLGARIEGTVTVAYSKVQPISSGQLGQASANFSGVTYQADLSYHPTSRISLSGSFARSVQPSNRPGNAYDIETRYRATAGYDLGNRFVLESSYEQREQVSHGITTVIALPLTNSTMKVISGSVRYIQNRHLSFILGGSNERNSTNNPLLDYNDDRVTLTADYRY